jgi:hypothetical protein
MPPFKRKYPFFNDEPGAAGGGGGAPAAPPTAREPETFSKDYVRELREENKGWRLKVTDLEKERDTHKTAADLAATTATAATTAAQTAADARVIRAELKAAALKAGMVDLDGLKLADLSTVKLDANGEVEGADALLAALKTAKPYLFGQVQNSSTPVNPPNPKPPTAKLAKDMTAEEYAAARKLIK